VVAVDVGKNCVALSVTDAGRHRLFGPVEFAMTRPALDRVVARIGAVLPADGVVKVGVEAAGHYHLPMTTGSAWPAGWEVLELNPAHVGEQRRVAGRRRIRPTRSTSKPLPSWCWPAAACRSLPGRKF